MLQRWLVAVKYRRNLLLLIQTAGQQACLMAYSFKLENWNRLLFLKIVWHDVWLLSRPCDSCLSPTMHHASVFWDMSADWSPNK
jgi:hypothetical protein